MADKVSVSNVTALLELIATQANLEIAHAVYVAIATATVVTDAPGCNCNHCKGLADYAQATFGAAACNIIAEWQESIADRSYYVG